MAGRKDDEPVYGPLPPESSGWGEWRQEFTATARTSLPRIEGGKTVWKEVSVRAVRDPESNELVLIPGGEGEPIRWQDLRGILPEDQLNELENTLRGEAGRRKKGYKP
jgi:hypothetical protein